VRGRGPWPHTRSPRAGMGSVHGVPREVAAGRLERGAPLAGDEGPADPGHPQRPAVGGQQVQIARNARSGIAFASRTPQCAPKNASRSAEMMALVPRWPPAASSTSWTVDRIRGAARHAGETRGPVRPVTLLLSNCRAGELEMPTGAELRAVGPRPLTHVTGPGPRGPSSWPSLSSS
jgi:hypothetical protein